MRIGPWAMGVSGALGMSGTERGAAGSLAEEFLQALDQAIERLAKTQAQADERVTAFLARGEGELHQVALAVEEAALALQLALQIRNKAVEAYQELMRMQI